MEQIQELIQAGKIGEAIRETEAKLKQLPSSDFQQVIGKDLLHLQPALTQFLDYFYEAMTVEEELEIKAMYVEMNSFTTQYERWFLHALAYESIPRLGDLSWLTDFSGESEKTFTITGYEALQKANEKYMKSEGYRDDQLRQACELHEYLVILRVQELVKHTLTANKGKAAWADVPVFVSAHDYEDLMLIVQ
ncbi:hypothetical protein SAMN04488505_103115 [Chitinophaga rupis]|uniref:Uncharacterized protein n=1 Tax=Chitinophaga rupis TaxID=573321 RepID=A0A1H7UW17_9BACT|nr:hypothetical protein [Chitinophaga rupis]SEM00677.1 hypothetical protein SAMN04488505_103115 [Chitinophaga rupis]